MSNMKERLGVDRTEGEDLVLGAEVAGWPTVSGRLFGGKILHIHLAEAQTQGNLGSFFTRPGGTYWGWCGVGDMGEEADTWSFYLHLDEQKPGEWVRGLLPVAWD